MEIIDIERKCAELTLLNLKCGQIQNANNAVRPTPSISTVLENLNGMFLDIECAPASIRVLPYILRWEESLCDKFVLSCVNPLHGSL